MSQKLRSPIPGLTPSFVAQALSIPFSIPLSGKDEPFTGISTDSRKIKPGSFFIALPGDRFDGHPFIESAIQQGARAVLCRKDFNLPPLAHEPGKVLIFAVNDTVEAYRRLSHVWRKRFLLPVIAVAGSVGKTSTKEILTSILRGKWPETLKTQGSQNGFVGIPMTLLELRPEHQAAVIEVGIDEPGAMQQHIELVQPTSAILTAIGPEHLEKLLNMETVAREEAIALTHTAQNNSVVIHLDDPWIRPYWETIAASSKWGYTFDSATESWARTHSPSTSGVPRLFLGALSKEDILRVTGPGFTEEEFDLPLPGTHNAHNLLGAIAVAASLGLNPEEIRAGLKTFQGAEGRSEIRTLPGGTPVICDYYNAQPASMAAGLELLQKISQPQKRIRWACLGDMLEMGAHEERLHRELADLIMDHGLEHVLLYGPRMRFLENELQGRNFKGFLAHYDTHREMAHALLGHLKPGNAVLIKGSRGMKMEEVWKLIEAYVQTHWKNV